MCTENITGHIMRLSPSTIFTTRDMLPYGNRGAVDQALCRHVASSFIVRLANGVFVRDNSENLTVEEITRAKLIAWGKKVFVHADHMLEDLGLKAPDLNPHADLDPEPEPDLDSDLDLDIVLNLNIDLNIDPDLVPVQVPVQVPVPVAVAEPAPQPHARQKFAISSHSSSFDTILGRVSLHGIGPRKVRLCEGPHTSFVYALWCLGKGVTDEIIGNIVKGLNKVERDAFRRASSFMPRWLQDMCQRHFPKPKIVV